MWYILSFGILQKKKGMFLVGSLEEFFLAFKLGLSESLFSFLVLYFCLSRSVFGTLMRLNLNLSIIERLYKNIPPNIRMIYEAKSYEYKIYLDNSSLFVKGISKAWNF